MSPTSNTPSNTINNPAIISAISGCAPRPTINPKIPTPAKIAVVSTPNDLKTKNSSTRTAAYFIRLHKISTIALPFFNGVARKLSTLRITQLAPRKNMK